MNSSAAASVVVEKEKTEFVVDRGVVRVLPDGPLILRQGFLRELGRRRAQEQILHLLRVIQLTDEGRPLKSFDHFGGDAGAVVSGEGQQALALDFIGWIDVAGICGSRNGLGDLFEGRTS